MVPFRQRSPRRVLAAKAGLASAPRTSRPEDRSAVGAPKERFPSGFGSNGTRQHEAALNDVPRLGSVDAHRVSPRRAGPCCLLFRSPKGSIQQLLSWSEDQENRTLLTE
jgi:hypothetical protein